MEKKSETIVRYTAEDLKAMIARGEDQTDWQKAANHPMPDGSDPDDFMEDGEYITTELPMPRNKKHASLRLDADMLDWFRSQGRGYQTRMNAVLRLYYQQQTQKRG
jgi:uncharacterized protein (DUF4415 family)